MILGNSRPPRPSALLFDLDGTLIDSRRDIAEACNATRRAHGRPPLAFEAILGMVGDGARALVARAFDLPLSDPFIDEAVATYNALYLASPAVYTTLLPGVRELLELAKDAALPCAIVTNKPRDVSERVIEELAIALFFRAIWGGGDGAMKPAPTGILHVVGELRVPVSSAWMIGDGPQDIGAGKAAGCFTVGVPGIAGRDHLVASAPDLLVDSLVDLRALIPTE